MSPSAERDGEALFEPIAIVGMAGRFPGAADVDELWRNVRLGVESISRLTPEEMLAAGVSAELIADPRYVPAKGVLDGVELFDAEFFGFTPAEAELMDPQHRLFLECCWQACEDGGYDPRRYAGRIGVYAGSGSNSYLLAHLLERPDRLAAAGGLAVRLLNGADFLTTHVSYKLNLRGPSVAVQTACSTSLVAVHLACQALLDGDCEMALAGAVAASFPHRAGYLFQEGGIASPDGHCRAFDARAQGAVEGSGVGAVLLKRLADAVAAGDVIHAVVRGSAVNNDGASKAGFTAPSVETQALVVEAAMAIAEVSPESIGYLEAHGSGTPLGDPIEVESLTRAFRGATSRRSFCGLGSIKANIGHADNAAGIAGLIKVIQALRHREIPPAPWFEQPNPRLDLAASPFYVATRLQPWIANGTPRRAGVSSLGIGGTNAHVVLEEAPAAPAAASASRPWQLLALSARSAGALRHAAARLGERLAAADAPPLAEAAHTLRLGRHPFRHRLALVCRDGTEAAERLHRIAAGAPSSPAAPGEMLGEAAERELPVVFLLPGLGDQFAGMGAELYRVEPCYRAAIDRAAELLAPHLGLDLREVLMPADLPPVEAGNGAAPAGPDLRRWLGTPAVAAAAAGAAESERPIHRTALAHPAVFAVEYALAELWSEWGIRPRALLGYSLGEMVAACLAGVFSLADGLALVAARARLIEELPAGDMLAVPLSAAEVEPVLAAVPEAALSAANGPAMAVVGGPRPALEEVARRLAERGVASRRLHTRHAFHTRAMEPIAGEVTRLAAAIHLSPPRLPVLSNVTGTWLTAAEATDPSYWARHLCQTVRFAEGLDALLAGDEHLLLEVGPGQTLGTLARQHPRRPARQRVVASMRERREGSEQALMLEALGRLWLAGASPDWRGFAAHEQRRRVALPTYPFERRSFMIEGRPRPVEPPAAGLAAPPLPGGALEPAADALRRRPLDEWFYAPVWERAPRLRPAAVHGRWLVLLDEAGVGERLAGHLEERGAIVERVAAAARSGEGGPDVGRRAAGEPYAIDPRRPEDYRALLAELRARDAFPDRIVHLWALGLDPPEAPAAEGRPESFDGLESGFFSLLWLGQAIGALERPAPLHLAVVASGLHEVIGGEALRPERAALLGPCRVLPQEIAGLRCTAIDAVPPAAGAETAPWIAGLAAELAAVAGDGDGGRGGAAAEPLVALRRGHRWIPRHRRVDLPPPAAGATPMESAPPPLPARLRRGGVYLVTGALEEGGEGGLRLAEMLFRTAGARLVLLGGAAAPPRELWTAWLSAHDDEDETARGLRRLLALERRGCELLALPADVAVPGAAERAVAAARRRFGVLHGVFHAPPPPPAGLLQWQSREQAAAALAPWLRGTLALAAAVAGEAVELLALGGPVAGAVGGVGQGIGAAVAAFLETFAQRAAAAGGAMPAVQAVLWGPLSWQPVTAANPALAAELRAGLERFGIGGAEYDEAWRRILDAPLPLLTVATQDLGALRAQLDGRRGAAVPGLAGAVLEAGGETGQRGHERPALAVAYLAPRTAVERAVAVVWQESFGIDLLGVHDNFFDLAGNSLLAIQIVTRIAQTLGADLTMASLLEAPTIAELAARIDAAAPAGATGAEATAIVATAPITPIAPIVAGVALVPPAAPRRTIPRREAAELIPLSFDQERLWFNQQLDLDSPIYNIYGANRYHGSIEPAVLSRALCEMVRRHEILRTRFPLVGGQPMQQVVPSFAVAMPHVDLRALSRARRESETRRWAAAIVRAPFHLDRLPLFRTLALQLAERELVIPICIHHIVTDWISYYAFEGELTAIYSAFQAGQPSPLAELPVQFGDFAVWERRRLADPAVLAEQLGYWRRQLADAPDLLPLPTDRPRPRVQTPWGARRSLVLSPAHSDGVRGLAQTAGATLFIAVLAVFKALLVRLSGQEKLIVGTPIAHRDAPELEAVLGFFINQLALYTDLGGNPPGREVLRRVRDVALAAYAHQELPFARLIDALQPRRDLSRVPFTQVVLLVLKPQQQARPELPGVEVETFWVDAQRSQFDMTFSLWDHETVLEGWLEYNTDLFDGTTIDRMKEQLRTMLGGLLADLDRPLWDLPLLPAAQRHQLVCEWPAGDAGAAPERGGPPAHQLIALQAALQPRAEAVACAGAALTYGELVSRAGRLAARLQRLGVGPEVAVGLCCGRSPALAIGLLATLQAGGAFLPLDPAYPDARLALLMADALGRRLDGSPASVPAVVLADPDQCDRLRRLATPLSFQVIPLGEPEAPEATAAVLAEDSAGAAAGRAAYVIYTSGTTGTPKGVVVEHGSLTAVLRWGQEAFGLCRGDRTACLAPFSFDIFLFELLAPLVSGATVVIFDLAPALDLERLLAETSTLTWLHAVPALMRQIAAAVRQRPAAGCAMRHVCTGGDRVTPDVLAEMGAAFPGARRHVLYGPTEATILCCRDEAGPDFGAASVGSPLGRPIAGARLLLLDRERPAPIGVAGELLIGGPGVARGYLGQPDLTAARFPTIDEERWYRTGDLARHRPDGRLEFLGRADQQVKVRGFRIEIGEVEAAITGLPAVREAVVEVREGRAGKRLVAYAVPREAPAAGGEAAAELSGEMRRALREVLPEHLVPSAWVLLPALPLTSHGKVDRAALPAPPAEGPAGGEAAAAGEAASGERPARPLTPVEGQLIRIWSEVLGRQGIGSDDNFFALGGDSILSIQVVVRAARQGISLTPRLLFEHQTVAQLAAAAGRAPRPVAAQETVVGAVPLTPVQRLFFAGEPVRPHHDNQALLFAVARPVAAGRLAAALARLVRHHDALRMRFHRDAAGWRQVAPPPPAAEAPPLLAVDLAALAPHGGLAAAAIITAAGAAQASLDLGRGPLHRMILFDLGPGRAGRLLWIIHHLVVDGVSWRILLEDLAALYDEEAHGGAAAVLAPKTTSFKSWAENLERYAAESQELRGELAVWLRQPWDEVRPLPRDGEAPGRAGDLGADVVRWHRIASLEVDAADTAALLTEVPRVYGTAIQETLLAALARACEGWSGDPVLLVDAEGHGREEIFPDVDLSRTVGWFTTVYPLLLDLRQAAGPGGALKAVKEQIRRVPNGGLGFGVLRYLGGHAADLAALPRAEMSFNYLGQLDQALPADALLQPAGEDAGAPRPPQAARRHALEWTAAVSGGCLRVSCAYSVRRHRPETVARLLAALAASLRELIAHCRSPEAGGYTPSDFPLAGLDQGQLDRILAARKARRV